VRGGQAKTHPCKHGMGWSPSSTASLEDRRYILRQHQMDFCDLHKHFGWRVQGGHGSAVPYGESAAGDSEVRIGLDFAGGSKDFAYCPGLGDCAVGHEGGVAFEDFA
jgi:hypothetical protein